MAISHLSFSQIPHEWYMRNGQVMKFSMDSIEIIEDSSVKNPQYLSGYLQILDSNDAISEILVDDLSWKKNKNKFVKENLKGNNLEYRTLAVLDEFRFVEAYDSNTMQKLEIHYNEGGIFILDSLKNNGRFIIESAELISSQSSEYCLMLTVIYPDNSFMLLKYMFAKKGLISKREISLKDKIGNHINYSIHHVKLSKLNSNMLMLSLEGIVDTLGDARSVIHYFIVHIDSNEDISFKNFKKFWASKSTDLNGGFYNWGLPKNFMFFLNATINDSLLIWLKPNLAWEIEENTHGEKFNDLSFSDEFRIMRYGIEPLTLIDSSNLISVKNTGRNQFFSHSSYSCNSKISVLLSARSKDSNTVYYNLMSLSNDIQNISIKPQVKVTKTSLKPGKMFCEIPNFNKPYKRIEFRKGRQCSPQLRLFAFADSYYDSFEWHIANDTGGYDIRQGKKLLYDAPGKGEFYVTLKGIHKETGYFAWYSDSIDFNTGPQASFAADTNKWCQYVELQMKNTTQTGEITDEQTLWRIYHDGELERTYKQKNPKITFTKTGKYDIELHYSNGGCKDSMRQSGFIEIIEAPKPGFTINDSLFCAPDTLQIGDLSEGRITKKYYVLNTSDTIRQAEFSREIDRPGYYRIEQKLEGPTGCITHAQKVVRAIKGFTPQDKPIALTVNVLDSQSTELKWLPMANNKRQSIYRDQVKLIDTISSEDSVYYDYTLSTAHQSYVYHLKANDSCGHFSDFSNPVSTILLQSENINNDYVNLSWSAFETWQAGVDYYTLEVNKDGQTWESIENTSALELNNPVDESNVDQTIHYRIIAQEKEGYRQSAISNVVSERLLPTIFIPNAFSPNGDGMNEEFSAQGFGLDSVEMQVFARSGQRLFSSSNGVNSWDGYVNGEKQPTGIYYYIIKAITTTGKEIHKNGLVHLIGD